MTLTNISLKSCMNISKNSIMQPSSLYMTSYAAIKPIHDKFPLTQNGIVGLIAPPGSGKTFTYLKLAAQQEAIFSEPFFELIVICSTSNKFDKTVRAFKDIIKQSKVVAVKDTDLLDWLNKYMRRMLKYNAIMSFINSDCNVDIDDEEMQRILLKVRALLQVNPRLINRSLT